MWDLERQCTLPRTPLEYQVAVHVLGLGAVLILVVPAFPRRYRIAAVESRSSSPVFAIDGGNHLKVDIRQHRHVVQLFSH